MASLYNSPQRVAAQRYYDIAGGHPPHFAQSFGTEDYATPLRKTLAPSSSSYGSSAMSSYGSHHAYGLSSPRSSISRGDRTPLTPTASSSSLRLFPAPSATEYPPTPLRSTTPTNSARYTTYDHVTPQHSSNNLLMRTATPERRAASIEQYPSEHREQQNRTTAPLVRMMTTEPCTTFIPPQRYEDRGKPVIVLDLDETLIYARDGPVVARPGLAHFLRTLQGRCEVVVWTAGERDYALDAIRRIDPHRCIQHCIYRHHKWWTGRAGYTKNLNALGRSLERTVLIDNTPDCLKDNPHNSVLVKDYHGNNHRDETLFLLAEVVESVIASSESSYRHITDMLRSHPHIAVRDVPCDTEGSLVVHTLAIDDHPKSQNSYSRTNFDLPPNRYLPVNAAQTTVRR